MHTICTDRERDTGLRSQNVWNMCWCVCVYLTISWYMVIAFNFHPISITVHRRNTTIPNCSHGKWMRHYVHGYKSLSLCDTFPEKELKFSLNILRSLCTWHRTYGSNIKCTNQIHYIFRFMVECLLLIAFRICFFFVFSLFVEAVRLHGSRLTDYERQEVEKYPEIWFLGLDACKINAKPGTALNSGYDDDNGSYNKVSNN